MPFPFTPKRHFPPFGYLGLLLILVFWAINWGLDGLRTHWAFFPLWLGYILTVEALVVWRQGRAMITERPGAFAALFLFSAPTWWLFELINARTQYWIYTPIATFSDLEYYLYCTLNFTVVIPAVFSTAELVGTWPKIQRIGRGPVIGKTRWSRGLLFGLGWLMLAVALLWPAYGPALLWVSLFFILDPINFRLGWPSLIRRTARGDWKLVLILWLGCLICGFFWEMWNIYSSPKWVYEVPYVDFWYVFEMPLLGYLGYLPFALELYALYVLLSELVGRGSVLPEQFWK